MMATSKYSCELATDPAEITAAQRLRFQVFNVELNEGLDHSYQTHLDQDAFDAVCQHIVIRELESQEVIGTYRLQTGDSAATHLGYYCEQEFDLAAFESWRSQILELGRACIHRDHRNMMVLNLLWKRIAQFAQDHQLRLLIGCSSLTSQDPTEGEAAYQQLAQKHLADSAWRTQPLPEFRCVPSSSPDHPSPSPAPAPQVKIPKLLQAYLTLGAKIGGPPAIDREFKTIDFLTILDLETLAPRVYRRFFT